MSLPLLPPTPSHAEWPPLRRDYPGWRRALEEICARHGLAASELTRTREGTSVVFTTERQVIKLYPPFWALEGAAERTILGLVDGELGLRTPEVVATGLLEDWPYLAMTRLPGVVMADVWASMTESERLRVSYQVGEVLARLHALPTTALAAHPELSDRWRQLVTRSIDECVTIHRGHGAPAAWLAQLPAFFEAVPPLHPPDFAPVLLHGDLHSWHLLLAERDGRWSLDGLIDFDSALLGWREYEFAVAMLSFMARRPAVLAECVRGYGAGQLLADDGFPRRLMAYALLNRYWGLDFMLEAGDPDGRCATFGDLERSLFGAAPTR